jgi:hypothetical protein
MTNSRPSLLASFSGASSHVCGAASQSQAAYLRGAPHRDWTSAQQTACCPARFHRWTRGPRSACECANRLTPGVDGAFHRAEGSTWAKLPRQTHRTGTGIRGSNSNASSSPIPGDSPSPAALGVIAGLFLEVRQGPQCEKCNDGKHYCRIERPKADRGPDCTRRP